MAKRGYFESISLMNSRLEFFICEKYSLFELTNSLSKIAVIGAIPSNSSKFSITLLMYSLLIVASNFSSSPKFLKFRIMSPTLSILFIVSKFRFSFNASIKSEYFVLNSCHMLLSSSPLFNQDFYSRHNLLLSHHLSFI